MDYNNENFLVHQVLQGKEEAWDGLINLYKRPIYRFVYRLVGNHTDADDLSQMVFLQAFKHIKSFKSGTNFRAWLYKIAEHLCVDFCRKKAKEQRIFLRKESVNMNNANPSDGEVTELQKKVAEAINKLPEAQKIVMALHLEGFTTRKLLRRLIALKPPCVGDSFMHEKN